MAPRTPDFARPEGLEAAIAQLSALIAPGADALAARHADGPRQPTLLLASTPRAGSTAFLQWVVSSGDLATPTNLISRFYRGPAVGALVQRLLFDPALRFRDELALAEPPADSVHHSSHLGKTRGPRAPHEFWYFWRHFLGLGDPPVLDASGRAGADVEGFRGHLGALEATLGQPLVLKAMIASWELPWLAALLPGAVFVDLVREPTEVMASLLRARLAHSGDRRRWYAFSVPGLSQPTRLSPELEVAVQVRAMRRAIDAGLAELPVEQVVRVGHRAWRTDPRAVQQALAEHWPTLAEAELAPPRPPGPVLQDAGLQGAWEQSAAMVDDQGHFSGPG